MKYTLLRNAAATLSFGGQRFLIDPCLDPAGARPPVPNTPNQRPNPLVDLPAGWESEIQDIGALLVTHLHKDHFDDTAIAVLDHALPLFGQPEDASQLARYGFTDLRPVEDTAVWGDIELARTPGHHGAGEIGRMLAPVSGFVLRSPNETTVYLAGDTIWCGEVEAAIAAHRPDVIVVNGSGARFLEGDPIVMTAEDIARVHAAAPEALIVVVHLEAINHCLETRSWYRERLPELCVDMDRVRIPENGEAVIW